MTPVAAPAAPEDVELQPRDWIALSLPGLIWGSSFYLIAEGLDAFSPYFVSWMRIGFGMSVILAFGGRGVTPDRADWRRLILLSVVWSEVDDPGAEERRLQQGHAGVLKP